MTPERYQQIERLCHQAMERPAPERAAFLQTACAGDEALRREVESLLPQYENPGTFLETPPADLAAQMLHSQQTQAGPRRSLAHYQLRSLLGKGGMGEVYLAEDVRLERSVAIKRLVPQLLRDETAKVRFLREARAASKLDHPNIGTVHDVGEEDGELFIVMAVYEGQTLKQRLERGALPVEEAIDVLRQVALGLEAAHRAGIVHRDIKPANVFLTTSGTVKILDFGLAKLVSDSQGQTMTLAGQVMGTPLYMSPEQLRGEAVASRSDLWSLGALAYELLCGISPFQTDSTQATISRILNDEPASLASVPGVPAWLAELVSQLLRKNPSARPQSAEEVLQRLQEGTQLGLKTGRRREQRSKWPRRRLAFVVAGAIAAVGALGIYVRVHRRAPAAGGQFKSLAVLPFVNASENPDTEYLSDGIAETLIDNLSRLPNLLVIARTTAFRYKGKDVDLQRLRRELSVDVLLTGRVQELGGTLVVHADLINLGTGAQLWGEKYNRRLTDVLDVESGIAKAIADTLRPHLTTGAQQRVASFHTENSEAYQLYLRGRYEWNKRTAENLKKSIDYYNQAIEKDPGFALPYAGLADVYNVAAPYFRVLPNDLFPRAKAAALKALELDDTLAEAHSALALVKIHELDWAGAEQEFKRAIELNPGYAAVHYFYGYSYLLPQARFDEAIAEISKAVELDPFSAAAQATLGWSLFFARRFDEALARYRKAMEIDSRSSWPYRLVAELYEQEGEYEEAITTLEKLPTYEPARLDPEQSASLRKAYAEAGARGYWRKRLEMVRDQAQHSYVPPTYLAVLCMYSGDRDQAFKWLDKAYESSDDGLRFIKIGPAFDPLRSDPRFVELLRRVGLPP